MILQTAVSVTILPFVFIVIGFILVLIGLVLIGRENEDTNANIKSESKGIILLGPIPIVWGFGKKVKILVGTIAVVVFVLAVVLWIY
ncbi:DUF131 domain-containing protein [Candidatus Thorarchaeota archaeon]|nr:MAG: DUF131 domain-containing protein [Candidatus Thorarchaeota archaeon]